MSEAGTVTHFLAKDADAAAALLRARKPAEPLEEVENLTPRSRSLGGRTRQKTLTLASEASMPAAILSLLFGALLFELEFEFGSTVLEYGISSPIIIIYRKT
ncbi:hypothetical protein PC118_g13941 [Phytophthora cactorum]|uniref:Uncharacterized protein n=1 Tax=Phytophthora cactorum TaxID=29920 RepID=A0A8T1FHD2_9STRA|nr:hypothetical protein PC118_g13941 [Phytophthora cactorum]KAG2984200.1 hypothetical protein PC119_g20459 [Phytophthora cactorum]